MIYDTSRLDIMKGLIIGAEDTPYQDGVFIFDIFFEDNYPMYPPKVNLATTGQSQIRFNPNLYANGYVCLSILGTWRGSSAEVWSATSTISQVLMSI